MKRTLTLLVFLFALVCHSQAAGYFTGVWYCKGAPSLGQRISGPFYLELYTGNTFFAELEYDDFFEEVEGSYTITRGLYKISFVDSDGWVWSLSVNPQTRFVTGKFRSQSGAYKGSVQATFVETDELQKSGDAPKRRRSQTSPKPKPVIPTELKQPRDTTPQ
jgi:hypothetical protein